MSVLEEATEALRKRQAAADAALQIDQDYHASGTAGRAIASVDYVKATAELADQWLRLAAIEAGHNPYVNTWKCRFCDTNNEQTAPQRAASAA